MLLLMLMVSFALFAVSKYFGTQSTRCNMAQSAHDGGAREWLRLYCGFECTTITHTTEQGGSTLSIS